MDVDDSPTKKLLLEKRNDPDVSDYYRLCFGSRPEEELYAAADGPDCIRNVAGSQEHEGVLAELRKRLHASLRRHHDPRMEGRGWVFDCYPYYGRAVHAQDDWPAITQSDYQLRHVPKGEERPRVNAVGEFARWS